MNRPWKFSPETLRLFGWLTRAKNTLIDLDCKSKIYSQENKYSSWEVKATLSFCLRESACTLWKCGRTYLGIRSVVVYRRYIVASTVHYTNDSGDIKIAHYTSGHNSGHHYPLPGIEDSERNYNHYDASTVHMNVLWHLHIEERKKKHIQHARTYSYAPMKISIPSRAPELLSPAYLAIGARSRFHTYLRTYIRT